MCLSKKFNPTDLPEEKPKFGWKVYWRRGGRLYNAILLPTRDYTPGKWYRDRSSVRYLVYEQRNIRYRSGFHVFFSKAGAVAYALLLGGRRRGYTVKKVEVRAVRAYGWQGGWRAFIAGSIRIVP